MEEVKFNKRAGKETQVLRVRILGIFAGERYRQIVIKKVGQAELRFCILDKTTLSSSRGFAGWSWLDPKDSGLNVCQIIYTRAGEEALLKEVEEQLSQNDEFI